MLPDVAENRVEHLLGQPPGIRVVAGTVIAIEQPNRSAFQGDLVLSLVSEFVGRDPFLQ